MTITSQRFTTGFTLVELAIVMTIIGLIIGGVLKGQEVINNARTTAIISDINAFSAASSAFFDKYGHLPGDMPEPRTKIPGCTLATFCFGGNRDDRIGQTTSPNPGETWNLDQVTGCTTGAGDFTAGADIECETTQFWKHLALADFTAGVIPSSDPDIPSSGETHPNGRTEVGGVWHAFSDTGQDGSNISVKLQNPLVGTPLQPSGQNPITPLRAQQIDRKMDNERATSGFLKSVPYPGMPAGGTCMMDTDPSCCGVSNGDYADGNRLKSHNCVLLFKIQ